MSQLEEFINNYNVLVIDGETTSYYQLIHSGSDEIWHTFPCPADPIVVQTAVSNMAAELATGSHSIKVQALAGSKLRGQCAQAVQGRSAAAKSSAADAISHAKALSMNIETADKQLIHMSQRLEEANERARQAEERSGMMVSEVYKMGDLVHKFVLDKEEAVLNREERESRNKSFMTIAETIAPIVGQALQIGGVFMEVWIKEKKEEMDYRYEVRKREREKLNNIVDDKAN